jgi:hypothetical protein
MPCHINDCIKGYGMGWHITYTILKNWIQLLKSKRAKTCFSLHELWNTILGWPKLLSITLQR